MDNTLINYALYSSIEYQGGIPQGIYALATYSLYFLNNDSSVGFEYFNKMDLNN